MMCFNRIKRMYEFQNRIHDVFHGERVLKKIIQKYGERTTICVSQHPAIGDAYLASLYLMTYYKNKQFIVTSISSGSIDIYHYFNIQSVEKLSQEETDHLIQYCQFMGITEEKVKILHHQALKWHTGIAWYFHGVHQINFADVFERMVFPNLSRHDRKYPLKKADEYKGYTKRIIRGYTIVLFPYANTLYTPENFFWKNVVKQIKKKGYYAVTYVFDKEKPIEGTDKITCGLDEVISLVEYAGTFIGVRNGIMDILSQAVCRKIVLYPQTGAESWIHGKIIDFWSLRGFGYTESVEEYEWEDFEKGGFVI